MLHRFYRPLLLSAALLLAACGGDYGPDENGNKVARSELNGHWLVLNYWAEWCGPCRTEVPQLNALAEQLKGQGVQVVGVNFDNLQGAELRQAMDALGIRFRVLASDPAPRFDLPSNQGLPVTYLIDADGKVRAQLLGEQTAPGLLAKLKELRGS
ncbi:redoxin domain-containing protein [Pseudomonas sp. NPDC007930]|uniref:TlpA disulfide reductase family protein n=1 Tax=Pseudomonas sp. NPDC007930 TaxID=3364417 RepID=UPI0036E8575F